MDFFKNVSKTLFRSNTRLCCVSIYILIQPLVISSALHQTAVIYPP